jgi:hypothetical protein
MEFDPAAALTTAGLDVDVAGRTYTVPAMSALDWIRLLTDPDTTWLDIVPGLLENADDLDDAMIGGEVSIAHLRTIAQDVLSTTAGVHWLVAQRLVHLAARPQVGGELVLARLAPAAVSLGAYVLACYQVATRSMSQEQLTQFDMLLATPPAGVDGGEWYDEEAAGEGFLALMGRGQSYAPGT